MDAVPVAVNYTLGANPQVACLNTDPWRFLFLHNVAHHGLHLGTDDVYLSALDVCARDRVVDNLAAGGICA